jgi:hypothetical protein
MCRGITKLAAVVSWVWHKFFFVRFYKCFIWARLKVLVRSTAMFLVTSRALWRSPWFAKSEDNKSVLQSTVPSRLCEISFWKLTTSLILSSCFYSYRSFFDKVKIKNFKRLGNSTVHVSKGFHPIASSFANHKTGHARVILLHAIENGVNVYQQETSL